MFWDLSFISFFSFPSLSKKGADTNTNAYDPDVHASRAGTGIPLMLQHYWWSEECFIDAGFKDKLTSIRGNFYMNHLYDTPTFFFLLFSTYLHLLAAHYFSTLIMFSGTISFFFLLLLLLLFYF